ncbi:Protein kinase domain [Macleaya cordata]|uniref:Protein kinase domain n=1 Tax=Macleaya cordata TaxID=56857 RepID=A0A200QI14_MACCD|nr:Protein kinase domain [Macleaya cordata]
MKKEPTPISRIRKSYQTSRSPKASSSNPSTGSDVTSIGNYTTTGSSSNKDNTSRTSISSRTSLKSLKDSLPENAHIYDFSEIRSATNNFLAKRFSSSSSSAWRCLIRGKDVIVFQRKFRRPIETSQLRERLSMICKSHHISLIKLLGASISGDYIYLVYEYVNGANLRDCLRNPKNPEYTVLSTWTSRMQIAADLAQGLEYIHHYTGLNLSLVHNHIKSTSVIVTEPSFNARICHYGTAELCGEIDRDHHHRHQKLQTGEIQEVIEDPTTSKSKLRRSNSTKFVGTRGYMSPEYQSTGIATQRSDVYAFGVVILELLSGEETLKFKHDKERGDYRSVSVIETAREAIESDDFEKIRRWMDRRLKDSFPVEIAEKLTRVALECVQVDPDKRPDMRRVSGKISKLYLESMKWSNKMGTPMDFTNSLAPR